MIQPATGVVKAGRPLTAILTEQGSLNPAMCGQAFGVTRNGVKCP
jgi:hypothetical protein